MPSARSLVAPTTNPLLEKALRDKLARRTEPGGSLGELAPLALRLGLMFNTMKPRLREPQLLVCAADHGLAVDGIADEGARSTTDTVRALLGNQVPLTVFTRTHGVALSVVDCGIADMLPAHDRLMARKIAHGTRNARVGGAMSLEQAHAAMRAGMEIADQLRGNVTMLAGAGVGAHESAALVIARVTDSPVAELLDPGPGADPELLQHRLRIAQAALARHRDAVDPVEILAALGGFEVAVMVGVILMAASKRHLLMIDGLPACAALMVAARIAQPVTDYCVFCRSHGHRGLDAALALFRASALIEFGLQGSDGTGAVLAWPLIRSAAALLTEVGDGEDAGPTRPAGLGEPLHESPFPGPALY